MTARISDAFMDITFVRHVLRTLASDGFISDKHSFVPSRDALQTHAAKIGFLVAAQGFSGRLQACFIRHGRAGFCYVLFDEDRYRDHDEAGGAVLEWLDKSFSRAARIRLKWSGKPRAPSP